MMNVHFSANYPKPDKLYHLTTRRRYEQIIKDQELKPHMCRLTGVEGIYTMDINDFLNGSWLQSCRGKSSFMENLFKRVMIRSSKCEENPDEILLLSMNRSDIPVSSIQVRDLSYVMDKKGVERAETKTWESDQDIPLNQQVIEYIIDESVPVDLLKLEAAVPVAELPNVPKEADIRGAFLDIAG